MAILLAANANFVPTSPRQILNRELSALRWRTGELNDRVADYGYGGIELHYSKIFPHCHELSTASPVQAQTLGRAIFSFHESWLNSDPVPAAECELPRRETGRRNLRNQIGSLLLFPTGAVSLDRLEGVEAKLGRNDPMHYVMYADASGHRKADQAKTTRFPNSSIQPTIDNAALWNALTPAHYAAELKHRRFRVTLASFHMSRKGKTINGELDRWLSWVEEFLHQDLVSEVHVEVARTDYAAIDPERYTASNTEARALVENGSLSGTPLGELFSLLAQYKWDGNVAIEAAHPGISQLFGKLTPRLLQEIHGGLTQGVMQAMPHVTWRPFPKVAANPIRLPGTRRFNLRSI